MEYLQKTFLGGMNQRVDPTRLEGDAFYLLQNGRVRKDIVEPVKDALQITGVPQGKYQGIYAAGQFSILLVDGKAYLKDHENPVSNYTTIVGFQLDSSVDFIFAELVPSSTWDFGRAYPTGVSFITTNPQDTANNSITSFGNFEGIQNAGSEVAGIFQDGINQPFAISSSGTARRLNNFDQWNRTNREYVPVGKQLIEYDGIVYVASPDGTEIFRSVSGRPMDFTVPVDNDGNKIDHGDASSVSVKVSFNKVTCLAKTNLGEEGGVFVGTRQDSHIIIPSYDRLIFAEPTYRKVYLFPTGPLNQFSIVDLNGDLAFIDYGGIRSFNATQALKTESNNTPISSPVYQLFQGVTQTYTACADFDDYAFFAVNTIYGYGVLVYDKTISKFVSFDQYNITGIIKQFAVIRTSVGRKLLFITTANKLYEAFASEVTCRTKLYIGEWCSNDPKLEQKTKVLNLVFIDAEEAGTITATIYVDRKIGVQQTRVIKQTLTNPSLPITIPFGDSTKDNVQNFGFNFQDFASLGWKVGFLLEWDCQASLSHIRVETEGNEQNRSALEQQASDYANATAP